MKAKYIAVLLSFFMIHHLPVHAESNTKKPIPITKTANSNGKIDLNKADVITLTGSFKGIGKKRAEAIVAYRESHHGFKSIEEMAEIKGFGQRFIDTNREKLNEVFVVG